MTSAVSDAAWATMSSRSWDTVLLSGNSPFGALARREMREAEERERKEKREVEEKERKEKREAEERREKRDIEERRKKREIEEREMKEKRDEEEKKERREEERRREEREERRLAAAERGRTLASLSTLAATTETRFASRRGELVAARDRYGDPGVWHLLNEAVAFIDGPVVARMGQWRVALSAEVGTTTEAELARRLLTIETEAGAALSRGLQNLPAPAPLAIAPPPTPAPAPAAAPAQAPALPPPPAPNQFFITNAPANAPANAPHNLAMQRFIGEPEVEMTDAGDDDTLY